MGRFILRRRVELVEKMERAIIVGVVCSYMVRKEAEESLDELASLADTAGAQVVRRVVQERSRPDPAFYIGRGRAQGLASEAEALGVDLIIFNDDLSPAQVRNLERVTKVKIVDRSGLILDIFARRARSKEAKIQVELAQLQYLLPRLTRQWTHLSRQVGGIGARGPGETQLEVDRRQVKRRITKLSRALRRIEKSRMTQRKRRAGMFRVALVGYTNSGKSTLLNRLSQAPDAYTENRLFATLDPMTRIAELSPHQRILLTDTVGFIRKLPPHLIASFHSTLEEAIESDLLLHVSDVSHPCFEEQIATVENILDELQIAGKPTVLVLNKSDLVADLKLLSRIQERYPGAVFTSALNGWGIDVLKRAMIELLRQHWVEVQLRIPQAEREMLSWIHRVGDVLHEVYKENEVLIQAQLNRKDADKLAAAVRV